MNIKLIKLNENNPRFISSEKYKKLKKSIQDFPQMLELRPLIIDENNIVLGGNMRLKALQELEIEEVPVLYAKDLTEEQKKEFIIKDNISYGEWDWDILANEWKIEQLKDWGLTVSNYSGSNINLDDFFTNNDGSENKQKFKIVLEYTEEDYTKVNEAFKAHSGSKENIVAKLLGV